MQLIKGNTYPVRNELRAMGGKWNQAEQAWELPDEKAQEAILLVETAPKQGAYPKRTTTRFSGGRNFTRNHRGRCEDAPCCGCCD